MWVRVFAVLMMVLWTCMAIAWVGAQATNDWVETLNADRGTINCYDSIGQVIGFPLVADPLEPTQWRQLPYRKTNDVEIGQGCKPSDVSFLNESWVLDNSHYVMPASVQYDLTMRGPSRKTLGWGIYVVYITCMALSVTPMALFLNAGLFLWIRRRRRQAGETP